MFPKSNSKDTSGPASTAHCGLITPPPSPPLRTHTRRTVECNPQLDVQTLKKAMNLERGTCGSRTKTTGNPCNNPIQSQEAKIDSCLGGLISLTRSSPSLTTELRNLAKDVHCSLHRGETNLKWRVRGWKLAFPPGDSNREHLASIQEQIEDILGDASPTCAGMTKGGKPCGFQIGGRKVQNWTEKVKEITKPEYYLDDDRFNSCLRILRDNRFCHHHVSDQGHHEMEAWRSAIRNICNSLGPEQLSSKEDNTAIHSTVGNRSRSSTPALFGPDEYDTSQFNIITMPEHADDRQSSFPDIEYTLRAPLKKEEQKKGFMYAYKVEGNEGFVKIGYTARSIQNRYEEWEFHCNRRCVPIYLTTTGRIPHAARVEALCHAELKHRNIWIQCSGCLKPHKEWFQISDAEAVAVIQRWSSWIQSTPYELSEPNTSSAWTLSKEEQERVKDISQFMEDLVILY